MTRPAEAPDVPGPRWLVAAATGVLLALQVGTVLLRDFDGLYGQDAFAYHDRAQQLWDVTVGEATPATFVFGSGYPFVVALVDRVVPSTAFAGQLTSVAAAVACVPLTYLLARDLLTGDGVLRDRARWAAAVAAALLAASGQLWQWGITVMSDTTALALALLAAWLVVRYVARGRAVWLCVAAAALGLAVATRYATAVLVLPLAAHVLVHRRDRTVARHAALATAVGLVALAPQALLVALEPDAVLGHEWLRGWSPANAWRSSFSTPNGHADYPWPVAAFYLRALMSPRVAVPLLAPMALAGTVVLLRGRSGRQGLGRQGAAGTLVLLLGWAATEFVLLAGIPFQNVRWTLLLLPPLAVLAGVGLTWAWSAVGHRVRAALVVVAVASLAAGVVHQSRELDAFLDRRDADRAVADQVAAAVPANAQVLAFSITLTLDHRTDLDVHELYLLTPRELVALLGPDAPPTYVLVDVADLEARWTGFPPEIHWRRLAEDPGLAPISTLHGYTLFHVLDATPPAPS